MAISGLSAADASAITAAQTRQQIDIAVLKKVNDTAKSQGEAAIALLEAAADTVEPDGDADDGHVNVLA